VDVAYVTQTINVEGLGMARVARPEDRRWLLHQALELSRNV
jgi:hypothetical protein